MKKNINKEKCNAWCEMMLALTKMTRELSNEEYEYIQANFAIAFGKLKLEELEIDANKETNQINSGGLYGRNTKASNNMAIRTG